MQSVALVLFSLQTSCCLFVMLFRLFLFVRCICGPRSERHTEDARKIDKHQGPTPIIIFYCPLKQEHELQNGATKIKELP